MKAFLFPAALLVLTGCAGGSPSGGDKSGPAPASSGDNPRVVIETSLGNITVELYADKAPITVKNFLSYADDKHYDGTIFHRVMSDFMIQGGGFTEELRNAKTLDDVERTEKKTKPPIKNEADNRVGNARGTIAMARTGIVDSATSQFFINVKDNPGLNHRGTDVESFGYCAFGRVVEGMDVVDKIRAVPTIQAFIRVGNRVAFGDVPEANVVIKSVRRAEKK